MWATKGKEIWGFSFMFHTLHLIFQRGSRESFRTDPFGTSLIAGTNCEKSSIVLFILKMDAEALELDKYFPLAELRKILKPCPRSSWAHCLSVLTAAVPLWCSDWRWLASCLTSCAHPFGGPRRLSCVQSWALSRIMDGIPGVKGTLRAFGLGWVEPSCWHSTVFNLQKWLLWGLNLMHTTHFKYLVPRLTKSECFFLLWKKIKTVLRDY